MRTAIVLALVLSGCSMFRAAAKDPVAAVAEVKAKTKAVRDATLEACTELRLAEAAGKIPAGKVRDDLDLFCELDAAAH